MCGGMGGGVAAEAEAEAMVVELECRRGGGCGCGVGGVRSRWWWGRAKITDGVWRRGLWWFWRLWPAIGRSKGEGGTVFGGA
ncbi:hypothetical protein Tco_1264762 [Tanacetum coccineum]|uniref:Uncharacterized protein n=1 Tax=Tanacetum coccineum TaxID=301880 RepID=A0ABQ5D5Q3_9ASTR